MRDEHHGFARWELGSPLAERSIELLGNLGLDGHRLRLEPRQQLGLGIESSGWARLWLRFRLWR